MVPRFQKIEPVFYYRDIFLTQENGAGPKIFPSVETAAIEMSFSVWDNFGVGIAIPSLEFSSSSMRPSYSGAKTKENGGGREKHPLALFYNSL